MMARREIPEEDTFLKLLTNGFTGVLGLSPDEFLFSSPLEDDSPELSIWDDVDWWTGEQKGAPVEVKLPRPEKAEAKPRPTTELITKLPDVEKVALREAIPKWFQQENGRIPLERMVKVDKVNYLRADAARQFKRMRRAAKKDGINITFSGAQSGYRDYDTQVRLKAQKGDLAATPGHSNHGWGMAIDIGPEARVWVAEHGKKYGYHQLPSESWHFDFKPTTEMVKGKPKKRPEREQKTRLSKARGRDIGGFDLDTPPPISTPSTFANVLMSLATDDIETQVRGRKRRTTLADVPRNPKTAEDIQKLARTMAAALGWTERQWRALRELVQRESSWNPKAQNPESTAFGLFQFLDSTWAGTGIKKTSNVRKQIRAGLTYIANRYSDPISALRFHDRNGWY